MAGVGYNPLEGLLRLGEASEQLHELTAEVIAFHAAIEREVLIVLERLAPHPEHLARIGHVNRLHVLQALWKGTAEAADQLALALLRFSELRNSVAHSAPTADVERNLDRLRKAVGQLLGEDLAGATVGALSAGIIGFLADDKPTTALKIGE